MPSFRRLRCACFLSVTCMVRSSDLGTRRGSQPPRCDSQLGATAGEGLTGLADDVLIQVLDALAVVRLRGTLAADLGRDLADHLLVGAADLDAVLGDLDL